MAAFDDYYLSQAKLSHATVVAANSTWQQMRTVDEWPRVAGRLTSVVSAGQAGAAKDAVTYLNRMQVDAPINTSAFASVASDGRPLDSLLYGAVVHGREMSPKPEQQMAAGQAWLDTIIQTQIADAGRGATSVGLAAAGLGYLRHVAQPCCQRCAVLAGKWFQWNKGFARHPGCKCRHVPAHKDAPMPDGYTAQVDPAMIRDLTEAQRLAIADGADLNRVINAYRRGKLGRDGMSTLELAPRGAVRLTPEGIYRKAGGNRDKALELLQQHGYLRTPKRTIPVEKPPANVARITTESTAEWTDDQLDDALIAAFERQDGETVAQLEAIMNARDLARQEAELAAKVSRVKSADPRSFSDAEVDAFNDDEFAAWKANMQRVDSDAGLWRGTGTGGKKLTADQQLRADYDTYVYTEWLKAEEATNGNLFNRSYKAKGLDPISLWSGPWHVAQARASEELLRYWWQHPRINLATFKHQAAGAARYADAAAASVKHVWG